MPLDPNVKTVTAESGWKHLSYTLAHLMPRNLTQSKRARAGIRSLIRTGR